MFTDVEFDRIHGAVVFDRSGHRIGNVAKVYLDDATGAPMWVTVHTGLSCRATEPEPDAVPASASTFGLVGAMWVGETDSHEQ